MSFVPRRTTGSACTTMNALFYFSWFTVGKIPGNPDVQVAPVGGKWSMQKTICHKSNGMYKSRDNMFFAWPSVDCMPCHPFNLACFISPIIITGGVLNWHGMKYRLKCTKINTKRNSPRFETKRIAHKIIWLTSHVYERRACHSNRHQDTFKPASCISVLFKRFTKN